MDSEELSLSWSNHRDVLISVFDDLLSNNSLVDCTLAAQGQCLRAHKVVLSASSPYFQLLFSQDCEKHPIIFLKDVKFFELKAIIEFVYRGEVKIKESELGEFLEVANSLQIRGLNGIMKNAESQRIILPDSPPSKRKRKNSEHVLPEHDACDSRDLPLNYNPASNLDPPSLQSNSNFLESSHVAGSSRLESCDIPPKVQSEFSITETMVKQEPEFDIMEGTEFLDTPLAETINNNDACETATVPDNLQEPYGRVSHFQLDASDGIIFPSDPSILSALRPSNSPEKSSPVLARPVLLGEVHHQTISLQYGENLPPEENSFFPNRKAKDSDCFDNNPETLNQTLKKSKQMRIGCDNKCRLKCVFKISTADRLAQFNAFQTLRNNTERYQNISNMYVMKCLEKREGKSSLFRKSHIMRIFNLMSGRKPSKVCRTMFLNTFGISNTWLYMVDYRNNMGNAAVEKKEKKHISTC